MIPDVIQTERLTLRPFRDQDIDDVLEYARDPEWARYLPVPQPYTKQDAEQFIADNLLADRNVDPAWAIELEVAVVGGISLGSTSQIASR
jgi:RimJ/RimL family protein N-acetyltransferase